MSLFAQWKKVLVLRVVLGGLTGFGLALLGTSSARAAVSATVSVDGAKIHEKPAEDSKVIDSLPIGTMVRLGNKSQDGWRRVAIPIGDHKGKIGWIPEESVNILDGQTLLLQEDDRKPKRRFPASFRLLGGASGTLYSTSSGTGTTSALKFSYFAQGSFLLGQRFSLGLRGNVLPVTVQTETTLSLSVAVPVEYAVISTVDLQALLGAAPTLAIPSSEGASAVFGVQGYGAISYSLTPSFFIRGEGGYALSFVPKVEVAPGVPEIGGVSGSPYGAVALGVDF
jgi:hypothetical protein